MDGVVKCFTSSHHQQVTAGHTDDADVREGLEDVLQGGGGEGQDLLGGVLCNTLQHRLDGRTERQREGSSVKSETEKNRLTASRRGLDYNLSSTSIWTSTSNKVVLVTGCHWGVSMLLCGFK